MSTVKSNVNLNRFAQLAALGEVIFHIDDLANLWNITNKNTLHTTLKRYVDQGLLFRIYRGFYAIKPVEKIDPWLLGVRAIGEFAYVTTETILSMAGIIQQNIEAITVASAQSGRIKIGNNSYHSRQLADMYLFNPAGIVEKDGVRMATVERAVADMLYFNPKAYFDAANLIDWKKVKKIQKEIGYPINIKRS